MCLVPKESNLYRIVLRSHLGNVWMTALPVVDFATTFDARCKPVTVMTVRVTDQAELMGLLNELHGLGLDLLSLDFVGVNSE